MRDPVGDGDKLAKDIHTGLATIDHFYHDLDTMLGIQPVRVTFVRPGTFERYYLEKQSLGLDLAYLKPAHINAPDSAIGDLLRLSEKG